jgi:hypothetical protein
VQRHNELFEVVKSTPPDKIGAVIARRRKDFTVEFFNHLYYVAESYKDDPDKQKGEIYMRFLVATLLLIIALQFHHFSLGLFPCRVGKTWK